MRGRKYDGIYEPSTRLPRKISNLDIYLSTPTRSAAKRREHAIDLSKSKTFPRYSSERNDAPVGPRVLLISSTFAFCHFWSRTNSSNVPRRSEKGVAYHQRPFYVNVSRLNPETCAVACYRTEAALMATCRRGRL